uniref:Uncharacterized protein n=1 Tax=Anguilla anguilla TaxID=7936 RepID=A0A0E9XMI4_ANGAN
MRDEVGANHHSHNWDPVIVESGGLVFNGTYPPRKEDECHDSHNPNNQKLAKKQQKVCNFVQNRHPKEVPHQEEKGIPGRRAEVFPINRDHDVGVSVQELDEFFQTPEATLQTGQHKLCTLVLGSFELLVQVLQHDPDHLHNGEDEGPESQGASVVPEGPPQGGQDGVCRNVVGLLEAQ